MWDWLVHVAFYLGLILLLAFIVLLLSGKLNSVWQSIIDALRFG